MNKSAATNLIAGLLLLVGYSYPQPLLFSVGLLALSGALTNWLAVHMLFERVPGLYGSGVIPARFQEFTSAIRRLIMEQFFTAENIERFFSGAESGSEVDLAPVIAKTDMSPAFDGLISVIEESSFAAMLAMVGGTAALQPLREPFVRQLQKSLIDIATTAEFRAVLHQVIVGSSVDQDIRSRIAAVVEQRLAELTPQLVKEIIQEMIRVHLGWLVVWGGFFGGLIGLLVGFFQGAA